GGEITLAGELLTSSMEVRFGANVARVVSVAADGRSAVVAAPAGSAGPVDVTLHDGGETAKRAKGYAYYYGSIRITGLTPVGLGGKPYFLLTAQLNGADKRPDLAVVNEFDGDVSVLLGNGDGTFTKKGSSTVGRMTGTYPLMAATGDLNGDGVLDFVT